MFRFKIVSREEEVEKNPKKSTNRGEK